MAVDIHRYGSDKPIPFKITLNGKGVNPTLVTGDIRYSYDNSGIITDVDLTTITAVSPSLMPGVYTWTPTNAQASCEVMILNIKDQTVSSPTFDENMLVIVTGGDDLARLNGT